jgi:hypothetical protein
MVESLLNALLGCSHKRTTFPITDMRTARKRTHVTCLNCGKEFEYNWMQMKLADEVRPVAVPSVMPVTHH